MVMVTIEPQLMDSEFKVLIDGVTKRVSASFYKKVCFSQLGSLTLFQCLASRNGKKHVDTSSVDSVDLIDNAF